MEREIERVTILPQELDSSIVGEVLKKLRVNFVRNSGTLDVSFEEFKKYYEEEVEGFIDECIKECYEPILVEDVEFVNTPEDWFALYKSTC